jgi:hypothetical protein
VPDWGQNFYRANTLETGGAIRPMFNFWRRTGAAPYGPVRAHTVIPSIVNELLRDDSERLELLAIWYLRQLTIS